MVENNFTFWLLSGAFCISDLCQLCLLLLIGFLLFIISTIIYYLYYLLSSLTYHPGDYPDGWKQFHLLAAALVFFCILRSLQQQDLNLFSMIYYIVSVIMLSGPDGWKQFHLLAAAPEDKLPLGSGRLLLQWARQNNQMYHSSFHLFTFFSIYLMKIHLQIKAPITTVYFLHFSHVLHLICSLSMLTFDGYNIIGWV